jgi:hypothetical protein
MVDGEKIFYVISMIIIKRPLVLLVDPFHFTVNIFIYFLLIDADNISDYTVSNYRVVNILAGISEELVAA